MAQTKAKPKKRTASSSKRTKSTSKTPNPKTSRAKATKGASKAKVPLVAGGAALAGAAGGLALAASKHAHRGGIGKAIARRPKIKLDSKDVARAARGVGNFSAQVSEIAGGLESAAEGRNGRHRSPVEVVLQGLTARR